MRIARVVTVFVLVATCGAFGAEPGPQRAARPPVPATATIVSPGEGETIAGDIQVVVEVPAEAVARRYSLEVAYWDPERDRWAYVGLLGEEFAGGSRATHRVALEELKRFSTTATRWQIRARVTDPPWSWGPWRTFGLGNVATTARGAPGEGPSSAGAVSLPDQGRATGPGSVATTSGSQQPATTQTEPAPGAALPAVQGPGAPTQPASPLPTVRSASKVGSQPTRSGGATAAKTTPSPVAPWPGAGEHSVKLRVWNGIGAVDGGRVYVDGPIDVDWERADLRWWFEYRIGGGGRGPAPAKFRWELSRAPFPAWGEWHPPPGFGLTGPVETAQRFTVDLASLAPRPPGWAAKSVPVLQKPKGGAETVTTSPSVKKGPEGSVHLPDPFGRTGGGTVATSGGVSAHGAAAGSIPPQVSTGPVLLSLYVRVVPIDAAGAPTGRPSNAVELRFGPREQQSPVKFNITWPQVAFSKYRFVRPYDFDWQCWVVAGQDWVDPISKTVLFPKGTVRNLCEKEDSSILEDIGKAFGSFVDMLKGFVNWVSASYASLKSELISAVAKAIPGCSGSTYCEGAVAMGLNAGLAAMGMPPDLPDFDQLEAMGEGYLVDMIAQQAAQAGGGPVAEAAAEIAVKKMIAEGKKAMTSGGGGASIWIPDVSRQYKPLLLMIRISNPLPNPTTPVYLEVAETGSTRYGPRKVPIPSLAPKRSYEIAVALEPTQDPAAWMELLPTVKDISLFDSSAYFAKAEQAKAALAAWKSKYQAGQVKLRVSMRPQFGSDTGYEVPFEKTFPAGGAGWLVK